MQSGCTFVIIDRNQFLLLLLLLLFSISIVLFCSHFFPFLLLIYNFIDTKLKSSQQQYWIIQFELPCSTYHLSLLGVSHILTPIVEWSYVTDHFFLSSSPPWVTHSIDEFKFGISCYAPDTIKPICRQSVNEEKCFEMEINWSERVLFIIENFIFYSLLAFMVESSFFPLCWCVSLSCCMHFNIHSDQMKTCSFFSFCENNEEMCVRRKSVWEHNAVQIRIMLHQSVVYSKISVWIILTHQQYLEHGKNSSDGRPLTTQNRMFRWLKCTNGFYSCSHFNFSSFFPWFLLVAVNFSHNVLNSCMNLPIYVEFRHHCYYIHKWWYPKPCKRFSRKKKKWIHMMLYCVTWLLLFNCRLGYILLTTFHSPEMIVMYAIIFNHYTIHVSIVQFADTFGSLSKPTLYTNFMDFIVLRCLFFLEK